MAMEMNIVMYFQVAWITCFLILLMVFFAINCLHRHRQRPLGALRSDLDMQPLIPHDSCASESSITSVQESTLTMKEVLNKVWSARNKWVYIGIQLGLENDIDAIKLNHNNAGDCYREMLATWMRNETATWEKLIAALNSESVGFYELADSILAELQGFSELGIDYDATVVMTEPKKRTDEVVFYCQHCGSYSFDQCFKKCTELRTVPDSSSFPHLNTTKLTEAEKNNLLSLLCDQVGDMAESFTNLVLDMQKSFESRNIDPLGVATAALLISRRESSTRCMSLLSQKVDSIDKLINYLTENNFISFFNHHIIRYIIARFGDEADKRALLDYEEKFKKFCQRSIFEIPQDILGPIPKNEEKLVFKITDLEELNAHLPSGSTRRFKDCLSLNNVQIIRDKIAKALNLENSWRLTFLGASKGCIELTFSATNDVISTIKSQQLSLGIPSVSIAGSSAHLAELQKIGICLLCGPPGKPDAFEISDTGVCLRWSQPKYEGFYPILYYIVHCRFVDKPGATKQDTWRTEGETLSLKITDLPHNETLTFSVQAVTNSWHGVESEESEYVKLSSTSYERRVSREFRSMRRPRAYTGEDFHKSLTNESLDEFVLKVHKAKIKWYEIGLLLGLDQESLDKIRSERHNIPKDCLKDMLRSWLSKGNASKKALCEALNDQSVRFYDLSKSIAESPVGQWKVSTL